MGHAQGIVLESLLGRLMRRLILRRLFGRLLGGYWGSSCWGGGY